MAKNLAQLNFQHLRYFWAVARAGSLRRGAEALRLSQPTLSTQIRQLEESLGAQLFLREGRSLHLTETGRLVLDYAEEIFGLGNEMMSLVSGDPSPGDLLRTARFQVGVEDSVPKLLTRRLLLPLFGDEARVRVTVREDDLLALVTQLLGHRLDLVIASEPSVSPFAGRTESRLLHRTGVVMCAPPDRCRALKRGFPGSLDGVPVVLPTEDIPLRRSLNRWFRQIGIRPRVVAEVEDFALLSDLGSCGLGVAPILAVVEEQARELYGLHRIGPAGDVTVEHFAIVAERRRQHPLVEKIRIDP